MRSVLLAAALIFTAGQLAAAEPAASKSAAKAQKASSLAERRAAAAQKKLADSAKRTFTKFDANRDGKLDNAEWTKAQLAVDKMIEGDVVKAAGARREAVKQALGGERAKPEIQLDEQQQVTPEALEAYAKALAEDAAAVAKDAADVRPIVGGEQPENRKTEAQRRREEIKQRARGNRGPTASERHQAQEQERERQRQQAIQEEAVRRATGGRIGPNGAEGAIRDRIIGGGDRPGARPGGDRPGIRPEGSGRERPRPGNAERPGAQRPSGRERPNAQQKPNRERAR